MLSELKNREQSSVFDEIASLGSKYDLTTARFFRVLDELGVGKTISKEDLMRTLVGPDYDTLPDGKKNLIWGIIDPDIDQAEEMGELRKLEGDKFEILSKAV